MNASVRTLCHVSLAALALSASIARPLAAAPLPRQVGQCTTTTVAHVGVRLFDPRHPKIRPNATLGSAVDFANGGHQVSYGYVRSIAQSLRGDPVRVCLVQVYRGCQRTEVPSLLYRTTNQRTHKSWTLWDAGHLCG